MVSSYGLIVTRISKPVSLSWRFTQQSCAFGRAAIIIAFLETKYAARVVVSTFLSMHACQNTRLFMDRKTTGETLRMTVIVVSDK